MQQWGCAAALVVALGAAASSANDSSASVATGGLVLQKSDSIAMLSEDLYVSADEMSRNREALSRRYCRG